MKSPDDEDLSGLEASEPGGAKRSQISLGPLDRRIGYLLRRAQIAVFQDFYRAVGALGLSPAQYSVLTVIENNPGLSQTQAAAALGIKKTNFVAMINELEAQGLAERVAIPHDRRSVALHLTWAGRDLIARLHAASAAREAHIRDLVGEEAYEALLEPLRKIALVSRDLTDSD